MTLLSRDDDNNKLGSSGVVAKLVTQSLCPFSVPRKTRFSALPAMFVRRLLALTKRVDSECVWSLSKRHDSRKSGNKRLNLEDLHTLNVVVAFMVMGNQLTTFRPY